jgi:hypothetical protein
LCAPGAKRNGALARNVQGQRQPPPSDEQEKVSDLNIFLSPVVGCGLCSCLGSMLWGLSGRGLSGAGLSGWRSTSQRTLHM